MSEQLHKFKNLFSLYIERKNKRKSYFILITGADIFFHFLNCLPLVIEVRKVILYTVNLKLIF